MARGKHATHAAATKVREDAINEAESGRRQIAKLTKENAELHATLESEREAHTSATRALNGMLADATTPEIIALRQRVEDAEHIATDAVHEVGMRVRNAFGNSTDFRANTNLHVEISDALGITVAEFLQMEGDGNRRQRRVSRDQARSISAQAGHGKGAGERLGQDKRLAKRAGIDEGTLRGPDSMRGYIAGVLG